MLNPSLELLALRSIKAGKLVLGLEPEFSAVLEQFLRFYAQFVGQDVDTLLFRLRQVHFLGDELSAPGSGPGIREKPT